MIGRLTRPLLTKYNDVERRYDGGKGRNEAHKQTDEEKYEQQERRKKEKTDREEYEQQIREEEGRKD